MALTVSFIIHWHTFHLDIVYSVVQFGWIDHEPPPFPLLIRLIANMYDYLGENAENGIAIHCKVSSLQASTSYYCVLGWQGSHGNGNVSLFAPQCLCQRLRLYKWRSAERFQLKEIWRQGWGDNSQPASICSGKEFIDKLYKRELACQLYDTRHRVARTRLRASRSKFKYILVLWAIHEARHEVRRTHY